MYWRSTPTSLALRLQPNGSAEPVESLVVIAEAEESTLVVITEAEELSLVIGPFCLSRSLRITRHQDLPIICLPVRPLG
jgi:hypothetical protein